MLQRAVVSVRQQDFEDFELIVVDDGSREVYSSSLSELKDARVRVIRSTINRGAAAARNIGIESARGEYISFIDDDDEYLRSFLACTYSRLKDTPREVGMSWCSVKCIEYPQDPAGPLYESVREFATEYQGKCALFENLLSIGTGFGVTIKANCLQQIGPFNSDLKTVEDTDMFLRILMRGFIPIVVPGVHTALHNHRQRRLTDIAMHPVRIQECGFLLERYAEFLKKYPSLRNQILNQINCLRHDLKSIHPAHAD